MKRTLRLAATLACSAVLAFGAFPRLVAVEPAGCPPGGEAAAQGQNLDSETVAKLFLTAGGNDIELEIVEQSAESIRFKVPDGTAEGTYNLMVQTGGAAPALMEQPVRLQIADAETLAKEAEERKKQLEDLSKPAEPAPAPEDPKP